MFVVKEWHSWTGDNAAILVSINLNSLNVKDVSYLNLLKIFRQNYKSDLWNNFSDTSPWLSCKKERESGMINFSKKGINKCLKKRSTKIAGQYTADSKIHSKSIRE